MHEGETVLTDASKRQMRTTDYRKDYKLARTLGQGSFAKVKIGTCHADGRKSIPPSHSRWYEMVWLPTSSVAL